MNFLVDDGNGFPSITNYRDVSTKNKLSDSGKIKKAIEAIKNKLIRTGGKDIKKKNKRIMHYSIYVLVCTH